MDKDSLKKIISHSKEYGFIFPSSEIYEGLNAIYDYAHNGTLLKNNIREYWYYQNTQILEYMQESYKDLNIQFLPDNIHQEFTTNTISSLVSQVNHLNDFLPTGIEDFDEIKHSQMRKVIAKRLGESKFTAPHYYLAVEFDMDNAVAFRQQFNSIPDTKISFNDIIVKASALALREHPQVNSQWFDDRMKLNNHVHIGVAVAVEDGLVVPVVKFANEQTLPQIGAAVNNYASKARNKKLTPQEMEGSTFTISNLGMFGIESFTSIINQPNSAILSVGSIVQKPVVKNDKIVVGNTMKLTLACDHRTVDGATGAAFLQTLKGYIENPITMLL